MTTTLHSLSRTLMGWLEQQARPFDTGARGVSPKLLKEFASLIPGLLTPRVQGRGGFPEVSGALTETRSRAFSFEFERGGRSVQATGGVLRHRAHGDPRPKPQGLTSLGPGILLGPSGRGGVGSIRAHGSTPFQTTKSLSSLNGAGALFKRRSGFSVRALGESRPRPQGFAGMGLGFVPKSSGRSGVGSIRAHELTPLQSHAGFSSLGGPQA